MDNTAIERIATPDLTIDALALLEKYGASDDVVFFLGRLVWQWEMTECVPALMDIACDPARGLYARIASIRGVMTLGDTEQKDSLWKTIASHPGPLNRRLLAELLEWAAPSVRWTCARCERGTPRASWSRWSSSAAPVPRGCT